MHCGVQLTNFLVHKFAQCFCLVRLWFFKRLFFVFNSHCFLVHLNFTNYYYCSILLDDLHRRSGPRKSPSTDLGVWTFADVAIVRSQAVLDESGNYFWFQLEDYATKVLYWTAFTYSVIDATSATPYFSANQELCPEIAQVSAAWSDLQCDC